MDLQNQPTHNYPSPTSSSAFLSISGFSVQFSCWPPFWCLNLPSLFPLQILYSCCLYALTCCAPWLATSHHLSPNWDVTSSSETFPIENRPPSSSLLHRTDLYCGSSLYCICEFTYSLEFICNPGINTCSAFKVILRCVQSGKNFCYLRCMFPLSRSKALPCLLAFPLIL